MEDSVSGTAAKMAKNISEGAAEVKETASDLGRQAADKIESIRETVAGTIEETSAAVQGGGQQISEIAHVAAEKIVQGASYVRETDLRVLGTKAKSFVKRHLVASMVLGVVACIFMAWSFRNDD